MDPTQCKSAPIFNNVAKCIQYTNNGTASFGGSYARSSNLVANQQYQFVLNYVLQGDDPLTDFSTSPVFRMVDAGPVVSSSSSMGSAATSLLSATATGGASA